MRNRRWLLRNRTIEFVNDHRWSIIAGALTFCVIVSLFFLLPHGGIKEYTTEHTAKGTIEKLGDWDTETYSLTNDLQGYNKTQFLTMLENTEQCIECHTIYQICNPTNTTRLVSNFTPTVKYEIIKGSLNSYNQIEYKVEKSSLKWFSNWTGCYKNESYYNTKTSKNDTKIVWDNYCVNTPYQASVPYYVWETKAPSLSPNECVQMKVSGNIERGSYVDNVVNLKSVKDGNSFMSFPEYAPWNANWHNSMRITIHNNESVTNAPVEIPINGSFDLSYMEESLIDLRCIDATNTTELGIFIARTNQTDGNGRIVCNMNISAGDTEFYVYYNNSLALNTSSAANAYQGAIYMWRLDGNGNAAAGTATLGWVGTSNYNTDVYGDANRVAETKSKAEVYMYNGTLDIHDTDNGWSMFHRSLRNSTEGTPYYYEIRTGGGLVWLYGIDKDPNRITLRIRNSGGQARTAGNVRFTNNTWNNVFMNFDLVDGVGQVEYYWNGTHNISYVPDVNMWLANHSSIYLGTVLGDHGSYQAWGKYDDIIIFNEPKSHAFGRWITGFPNMTFFEGGGAFSYGNISITNHTEYPADPAVFGGTEAVFVFNATVCHTINRTNISYINFTWEGVSINVTSNITINDTCINSTTNRTGLGVGTYSYSWQANSVDNGTAYVADTYTVTGLTNNSVWVTITPSNSVDVGTQTTALCQDTAGGTLSLTRSGLAVANPDVANLNEGTYVYNCTSTKGNYTTVSNTSTLLVGVAGTGCSDNTTYAFRYNLTVTANITGIDFQTYVNNSYVRPDIQDIYVPNHTVWVNSSRYIVINTTGDIGSEIYIYFGNYLNNLNHSTWENNVTVTDTIGIEKVNNYIYLTFKDEKNMVERLPPNSTVDFKFYCSNGQADLYLGKDSGIERILVATFNRWSETDATFTYNASDYYKRNLKHDEEYEARYLWTVDALNHTVVRITNDLDDLTGDFTKARLTVKKWIGGSLRIIHEINFDASTHAYFYGVEGDKYQYYINNSQEVRSFGDIYVDRSDTMKYITILRPSYITPEFIGNLSISFQYSNITGAVNFSYYDPYNRTNRVNMSIYNMSDGLLSFQEITDSNNLAMNYLVPNTTHRYYAVIKIDHEDTIGIMAFYYTFGAMLAAMATATASIGAIWLVLASLFGTLGIGMAFSPKNLPFGTIIMGFILMMFSSLGWFGTYMAQTTGFALSALTIGLGFLWLWRQEAQKK